MNKAVFILPALILLSGCKSEVTLEMCENYYSQGYSEGKREGYDTGYEEGKEEGYNEGYGIVEEICGGDATCDDYY